MGFVNQPTMIRLVKFAAQARGSFDERDALTTPLTQPLINSAGETARIYVRDDIAVHVFSPRNAELRATVRLSFWRLHLGPERGCSFCTIACPTMRWLDVDAISYTQKLTHPPHTEPPPTISRACGLDSAFFECRSSARLTVITSGLSFTMPSNPKQYVRRLEQSDGPLSS